MRAESSIMLTCAQKDLAESKRQEAARLFERELDWDFLWSKGRQHGMLPLLYKNLKTHFPERVPPTFMDRLQVCFQANARHGLRLTGELLRLLNELDKAQIPVIPLKGPALAYHLYGDADLRPFTDLDLLFRREDVPRAKRLFWDLGYRMDKLLSENQKTFLLEGDFECSFSRPNGNLNVEIIWKTPGDFPLRLDFRLFWEDLERTALEGRRVLALSPENLFLFLCLHQATHCWPRLIWLCDLLQVIRLYPSLKWMELYEKARKQGCLQVLLISLNLLQELWAVSFPEPIRRVMEAHPEARKLTGRVLSWLLQEENESGDIPGQVRFLLKVTDRIQDRIGYCLRQVFIPNINDWLAWPLPRSWSLLFYLLRPLRLATKYGSGILRYLLRPV